jgi:hypothetical protein
VALLSVLPFVGSLWGGFVYDDHALIEERAAIRALDLPTLWQGEFWQGTRAIHLHYWRPLVSTSYALDWALWHASPRGFHVTNLLLHAAVCALLFGAFARWSRAARPPVGAAAGRGSAWGPFWATMLLAWHPTKVEAVSWIAGRTDLLCALGLMIMCAGTHRRITRQGGMWSGLALEFTGLSVALASKEHAVVAPALAAVEAFFATKRKGPPQKVAVATLRAIWPELAVVAPYLAARTLFYPIVPRQTGTFSPIDAALYTLETLGEFARVVVFPYPLSILRAAIRSDPTGHLVHSAGRIALGVSFLALVVILLVRKGTRPEVRCGLLLGTAALLPVANVIPSKMIFLFAERFAYLPLIGFAAAVVPAFGGTLHLAGKVLSAAAAAVFFVISTLHTRDFTSEKRLWAHELAVDGAQPLALRWASEEALNAHRTSEALQLSLRGYRSLDGWTLPQPYAVEFALRAARTLELGTLDRDRAKLRDVARFYRVFLKGAGTAQIDIEGTTLAIDAAGAEAHRFREDADRVAKTDLWAGIAASRAGECEEAASLVAGYLAVRGDPAGRISAVLALARCRLWDQATAAAVMLDARLPAARELVENIGWAKEVLQRPGGGIEASVERSRAATLVGDRAGAYAELLPHAAEVASDRQATLYFARVAWAAGEDSAARDALLRVLDGAEATRLLADWSRELGRDPP